MLSFGLMAPLVFGAVGLGVDVTMWRMRKETLQNAVDAATVAGAHAYAEGAGAGDVREAVARELARNGYASREFDIDLGVGSGADVTVHISQPGQLYFSGLLLHDAPLMDASAMGGPVEGGNGEVCVLGLDGEASATIELNGTTEARLGCGMAANSAAGDAVRLAGNTTLEASLLHSYGGIDIGANTSLSAGLVWPYAPRIDDPYGPLGRDLRPPVSGVCDENGELRLHGDVVLEPGRYCGGITVLGANVRFEPGLYVLQNGGLTARAGSSLAGEGVTFVLTGTSASDIGGVDIAGGTELDLVAPDGSDGWAHALNYEGILFFQDSRARSDAGVANAGNRILGGSGGRMRGAIYFPNQKIIFSGGGTVENGCLQLVGRQVELLGNALVGQDADTCELVGVDIIRSLRVLLLG